MTILVVEDEPLLAYEIADFLHMEFNSTVIVVGTVAAAEKELTDQDVIFAVLDINVGFETSFDLARQLRQHGKSFVFVSAMEPDQMPNDLRNAPFLPKPCDKDDLKVIVQSIPGAAALD